MYIYIISVIEGLRVKELGVVLRLILEGCGVVGGVRFRIFDHSNRLQWYLVCKWVWG